MSGEQQATCMWMRPPCSKPGTELRKGSIRDFLLCPEHAAERDRADAHVPKQPPTKERESMHEQYSVVGEIVPTKRNYKAVCAKGGCDWKAYRHGVRQARHALAVHTLERHARLT